MVDRQTLLSVCIPTYNPGSYLRPALESVLVQDYDDFEVLVVDDCSTDPVETTVNDLADERVFFHRNPYNLGLVGNWNRCIELARGEYITLFHQDDVMFRRNLQAKVDFLEKHASVGLVYSNIVTVDSLGAVINGHWAEQPIAEGVTAGDRFFEQMALHGNFVSCPSVMVRSECFRTLGGFDTRLPFTCDMEMWMRIANRYDIGYLSEPLIGNRVHPAQETQRFSGSGREIREVRRALKIAFAEHAPAEMPVALKRSARRNLVTWAYRMGRWKFGQRHWRPALGYFLAGGEALLRTWG